MNNFKKIGMTALAASLVSTSVFAGEIGSDWFSVNGNGRPLWYCNLHEATSIFYGKPVLRFLVQVN